MTDTDRIIARLEEFAQLIANRDFAIIDTLANPRGFVILGSEAGERAASRAELLALFEPLFAKSYRLQFVWQAPEVIVEGDIAWVNAEGMLHLIYPDREAPTPFRMVGIFQKHDGDWHWRLFSGSEPVPPPPPA